MSRQFESKFLPSRRRFLPTLAASLRFLWLAFYGYTEIHLIAKGLRGIARHVRLPVG